MRSFLIGMIRASGQAPRHLVTDRGKQFTARSFRRGCRRAGIRQRFGAIGIHGSIALVERCIRTLKEEGGTALACADPVAQRRRGAGALC